MEKIKVSPFEFVFMQAVHADDPSKIDIEKYETWTREEELDRRLQTIQDKAKYILENSKKI